jgi:phospholipase C
MAVGPGFRVPMTIVSPYAPPNTVYSGVADHTSILQFIERTFSTASTPITLPTIAAARRGLDDLTQAFDFTQAPNSPSLPTAAQLYSQLSGTILSAGGVAGCVVGLPSWLLPLLGVS